MSLHRRKFLKNSFVLASGSLLQSANFRFQPEGKIITVNGPIDASQMGMTLVHEHVQVDFIGADKVNPGRYNADEIFNTVLPYLQQIRNAGCKTFIDCTPPWLGRDVKILKRLSDTTGLNIITNTGYYGASADKFLPASVKTSVADEIAAIWTDEAIKGIDNTGIKPGFMKLGLDNVPFSHSIEKILKAASITYLKTGLPIGVHTTRGGEPAKKELQLLNDWGDPADRWIWIHAQNEKEINYHIELAKKGAWISLDGISKSNVADNINTLQQLKKEKLLHKILLSQDAGWYNIGEAGGGKFRNYMDFFDSFLPALKKSGFSETEIHQLTFVNPSLAFTLNVKR